MLYILLTQGSWRTDNLGTYSHTRQTSEERDIPTKVRAEPPALRRILLAAILHLIQDCPGGKLTDSLEHTLPFTRLIALHPLRNRYHLLLKPGNFYFNKPQKPAGSR
jgi:hypothetical protein